MTNIQKEQLNHITQRWQQAHCQRQLLGWHSFTGHLLNMAGNLQRLAWTIEDLEFAGDLYTLAGLSYERSTEFMPPDLSHLPNLMCEAA